MDVRASYSLDLLHARGLQCFLHKVIRKNQSEVHFSVTF